MGRRFVMMGLLGALVLWAAGLVGLGQAWAAGTHSFDPTLSLTGDCSTSSVDAVPDPGCPGGTHPPSIWSCTEGVCSSAITAPSGVATDEYGDIYVASHGRTSERGAEGRIDVFDSEGFFLTEIPDPGGPVSMAVDSKGNLYVQENGTGAEGRVNRFTPSEYDPEAGVIEYANAPVAIGLSKSAHSVSVYRSDDPSLADHLLIDYGEFIAEFGSAAEGNPLLDESIGVGSLPGGTSIDHSVFVAADAADKLIYASVMKPNCESEVQVFEAESPHNLVRTLDGSTVPAKNPGETTKFTSCALISIAVDEGNGHVFLDDLFRNSKVYELTETGEYVSTIAHSFSYVYPSQIAMDNGAHSPNGALNPLGRYLFVPSNESGVGHAFAFAPLRYGPPEVELLASDGLTETEAQLHGRVNPDGAATHYRFEYVSARQFAESGFAGALVGGEGALPGETIASAVSASLAGLAPGTAYRFRLLAENGQGKDEEGGTLSTYPAAPQSGSCANEALRTGFSAGLPDCRAYELVTPPDTGGRPPYDPENNGAGDRFGTATASPAGDSVAFMTLGGAIAGTEAAGAFNGSPYLASRGSAGWSLESVGLSGAQSSAPASGGLSPEHGYAVESATGVGSLVLEGPKTRYLRHPDGSFHLLGQGSIGSEPQANARFLAPGGAHAIFTTGGSAPSARRLEPEAPPSGTAAIYDRTPDEVTHVVSLLPGNVTPAAREGAEYLGASAQGNAVAFTIGDAANSPIYLRLNDSETLEATPAGATFAGLSADGRYAFYLSGADLFRYDTQEKASLRTTSSHNVTVVNVPAQGTGAYFVSPSKLTGEANPNGEKAAVGAQNLYLWSGGSVHLVAKVTERDVKGELNGLGGWVAGLAVDETARNPSRTTPDGGVLVFESRAKLTGYVNTEASAAACGKPEVGGEGCAEVYRFDAVNDELTCLSCSPIGAAASSDARLQSVNPAGNSGAPQPTGRFAPVHNVAPDGRRVFFETSDPLVAADTDSVQDVYEWEAAGEGSCTTPGGCVYLISSGHSARDNYLYGVSESGDDVFISTTDLLVGADQDSTPSIYDARVGGGFPEAATSRCQGEGCRPGLMAAPVLPAPESGARETSGNVTQCPPHQRKAKRKGKLVCVAKHRRHRKHKQAHHRRTQPHAKPGRGAGR
jgi:hypothetical protein